MSENQPESERTPLLSDNNAIAAAHPSYEGKEESGSSYVASSANVGAGLPPPYSPMPQGGVPFINCMVCPHEHPISLEGRQHLHVIKCPVCNEATPIRPAPPGRQYVRCTCKLLLVCRSGASRISCPRETCKRINTLIPGAHDVNLPPGPRYQCAYCPRSFVCHLNSSLGRCPHCRSVSSVGFNSARRRGHLCLVLAFCFLAMATGITVGTYETASSHRGLYVSWIGGYIGGVLFLVLASRYYFMKTSLLLSGNIQA